VLSAAVRPELLRRGQVLLVRNPAHTGTYLMHRYERTGEGGTIITKGDANRVEDSTPVAVRDVRGLPKIRIPLVGLPVVWLRFGAPPAVQYAGGAFAVACVLALVRRPERSFSAEQDDFRQKASRLVTQRHTCYRS
jgi:signal peptidase